jgi:putative DNA primase/helicase
VADDSMFAPLGIEEIEARGDKSVGTTMPRLIPIIPIPSDAPPCAWCHPKHGMPVAFWPYHQADGQLVAWAARVEFLNAKGEPDKDVYPITYCRVEHANGYYHSWRAKSVPAPRPLHRLCELLASPNAPVVVCEGEKKADRVSELFPGWLGTTSMGGARAAKLTDWTPLAGRDVVIWPDHDVAGLNFAREVVALLRLRFS